jgi:prepilin-type N-terminal cleavage/methylation domain-containing protein
MRIRSQGFTLMEIAIVLIIIGALLTGVMITGDAVLQRARFASLLSSIKDLANAAQSFKARYGYFPGDLPNANTVITGGGGVSVGCSNGPGGLMGDGLVDSATESDCALEHLVKAGSLTKAEYRGGKYVLNSNIAAGVQISLWFNALTNENVIRISSLPCALAIDIDQKFDSTTSGNTPFNLGWVTAQDAGGAQIATCTPNVLHDPVSTVLLKY